ncbi:hypothetical protein C8R30_12725 [Nitrosomonas nitrosa]|uniref:hypothetical protein n=1 Tax=Nitrosomonas nitrosa TaxID=52442 RepID=UPI000D32336C|nr:hypothetical protein [Nitrosomonas nitrosa]PTQ91921.1 hypothetical protein C8R30_12725 [Nitrosomonas nitrosa]
MEPIPSLTALRQQHLADSVDTDQLREQARQRIEALASELWTDYNSHDPGITILEQLAYAITDLGLRSRLPIEDLLANGSEPSFYTAREVLPNAALTPNDYRRLLLALDDIVRDAQVVTTTSDRVEGLYALKVLFAEGRLNESWLEQGIDLRDDAEKLVFQTRVYFVPPDWRSLPDAWLTEGSIDAISLSDSGLSRIVEEGRVPRYHAKVIVSINSQPLELGTWIYTQTPVPPEYEALFQSKLREYLRSTQKLEAGTSGEAEEETAENKVIVGVFPRFRVRTQQILGYLDTLYAFLNQHRNLCEDWVRIEPVRIQQIAVCVTELELTPDAGPLAVLAEIYFSLQQFIEPQLRPRSLDQLLAEGKVPEDIFQGEQLEPESGFLLEEDLQGLERGNTLYTSDLVRLIMQVPGVFALSGLSLRAFIDRFEVNRDVLNCMRLFDPDDFYPRLSLDDCEIKLYRQGVQVLLDMQTVKDRVQQLHTAFKAGFPKETVADLPVPHGTALDIESYYSIQNEFPQTYRLRQGEITPGMPPERKAQAKQLKGYLLLFEQLLANYCSQLLHVHDLFSIRKQIGQTYYHQPLYWVPAVQALLQAFLDEQRGTPLSWEAFTRNCNGYIKALNGAAEDQQAFRERRQQFIEHLLSRYGESFGDYPAWVRVNNAGLVSSDLLMDQLEFLLDFPALSARRATAHNYGTAEVWGTDNVSGLEKRVARLLGMPDCRRRSLSKVFDIGEYFETYNEIDRVEDRVREVRFRFWNAPRIEVYEYGRITSVDDVDRTKYDILLSSTQHYELDAALDKEVKKVVEDFACHGRYYAVTQTQPTRSSECKYYINLLDASFNGTDPIARIIDYPVNRGEVEQHISEVIHLMQGRYAEGMHLIEHMLLRPMEGSTQALAPVQFELKSESGNTYYHTFVNDPYSFQISIFLPGWAPRFQDLEFRVIVERTIRQETPAHILPWIYWVDLEDKQVPGVFTEFEKAYQQWLESLNSANRATNQDNFIYVFNALVRQPYVTLTNLTAYRPFSIER